MVEIQPRTRRGTFGHKGIIEPEDRAEDFWARVAAENLDNPEPKGCWLWCGKINPRHGYGQFYVGWDGTRYKEWRAHRLAYRLRNGSIPNGALIIHSCDNKLCVNPDHLRAGTQFDNMRDASRKGRCRPQGKRQKTTGRNWLPADRIEALLPPEEPNT